MSPDCVFCKIRDGQIPSMKVYEDDATLAFMDINPINSGHCLVVTKNHAATIWDAEIRDLQAAIATAKRVAVALRDAVKPDGLNMLQANGAAAMRSTSVRSSRHVSRRSRATTASRSGARSAARSSISPSVCGRSG